MEALASPISIHRPLPAEEAARADFYALLARLLHAAPDAALLGALAGADPIPPEGDAALAQAWRNLVDASSVMDPEAAVDEYEALFIGMGKAAVSIYAGFYSGAPSIDHPRVRLQAELAALGLERSPGNHEPEDHFAALLDMMRVLVAGGAGRGPATLEEQKRFFQSYLQPGLARFFAAVGASPKANYYRSVAALGGAFTALETNSFLMD